MNEVEGYVRQGEQPREEGGGGREREKGDNGGENKGEAQGGRHKGERAGKGKPRMGAQGNGEGMQVGVGGAPGIGKGAGWDVVGMWETRGWGWGQVGMGMGCRTHRG